MTATATDGKVVRDLGEHGVLTFTDGEGTRRRYDLAPADGGKPRRLTSVSTILSVLDKPGLTRWSEQHGAAGAIEAVRRGEIDPATVDPLEAVQTVRALKLGADAAKNRAADRGLSVHDAFQAWCETGDLPPVTELAMEARPFLQGLARFLVSHDPTPIVVEQITCYPDAGYAGRLDAIVELDGLRTLLDVKTSPKAAVRESHMLQLDAYRCAEHALGQEPITQALVVAVGHGGQFGAMPCSCPEGGFLIVARVHELLKAVRRPIAAADRAAKKALEVASS